MNLTKGGARMHSRKQWAARIVIMIVDTIVVIVVIVVVVIIVCRSN